MHVLYRYFKSAVGLLNIKSVGRWLLVHLFWILSWQSSVFQPYQDAPVSAVLVMVMRYHISVGRYIYLVLLSISPFTSVHCISVPYCLQLTYKKNCFCLPSGKNWKIIDRKYFQKHNKWTWTVIQRSVECNGKWHLSLKSTKARCKVKKQRIWGPWIICSANRYRYNPVLAFSNLPRIG